VRALDEPALERAARGRTLALPRTRHRGKVGEVRAASVGSALELHDFRLYQPGDDLRHLDWNAVARTGEYVMRVRHDEVSPRVEVILDASRSMALSPAKAARSLEVALLTTRLALRRGLEPSLLIAGAEARRATGAGCEGLARAAELDGVDSLPQALRRGPPLRPCGLRLVVSDFLFETAMDAFVAGLSRGAAGLLLLQLLDVEDLDPLEGGARLIDAESGETLERQVGTAALRDYQSRFAAHQKLLGAAARRARGSLVTASTEKPVDALARAELAPWLEAG
jgi:uncharacterized protein (DUF58 family)